MSLDREVHVWSARTDGLDPARDFEALEAGLAEDERERARRFLRPGDGLSFLAARTLLRRTLSRYAATSPEAWRFRTGEHGRPELDDAFAGFGLRFNVSHTRGLVVCAVAHGVDVGVDVENRDRDVDPLRLARHVMSDAERESFLALDADDARERFFELWTLKEAYLKARGIGIRVPLSRVSFAGVAGEPIGVAFHPPVEDAPDRWQFCLLRPTPDHRAAVALHRGSGPDRPIVHRPVALRGPA